MNIKKRTSKDLAEAKKLFKQGSFEKAEQILTKLIHTYPNNFEGNFLLGYIALLRNKQNAKKWLLKAIKLKPLNKETQNLLAEYYYRNDEFETAANYLNSYGDVPKYQKLLYFGNKIPYKIAKHEPTAVKFLTLNPLPVVQVKINGDKLINLFIDTGGGEIILDKTFAKSIGIPYFGSQTGSFGGGKPGEFGHGFVKSLEIGDILVNNIPINIMPLKNAVDSYFGEIVIDGVIGTIFLYHFLTTIDYSNEKLILRPRTEESYKILMNENQSKKVYSMPFWLCGDHFMVTWGNINQSKPFLFFVDTGLVGGGFTCPKSTLKAAKIHLNKKNRTSGMGGGGLMNINTFNADQLSLGPLKSTNMSCQYGPFPPMIENAFGVHIGGLISHDFFKAYALSLDFDNMQYYLVK